jgi:hypothetical protein
MPYDVAISRLDSPASPRGGLSSGGDRFLSDLMRARWWSVPSSWVVGARSIRRSCLSVLVSGLDGGRSLLLVRLGLDLY